MRCCQRGDVLKLGVVSGYSRRRHVRSWASVGGGCGDGCDGGSGTPGSSRGLWVPWASSGGGGGCWFASLLAVAVVVLMVLVLLGVEAAY